MDRVSEEKEQQAVIEWCEWMQGKYPELKAIYHITNEGKRSRANGAALKAAGLKKGVPDLCLPCARGGYNALYIEMKKNRKSRPAKEQSEWIDLLCRLGNQAVVCYSADDAINVIRNYLLSKQQGGQLNDK